MSQPHTQEHPGLNVGRQVLSPSFAGAFLERLEDAVRTRDLPTTLDAVIAGAREALMAARDEWSRAAEVPERVIDTAATGLPLMYRAVAHHAQAFGEEKAEQCGRAIADLLFEVTAVEGAHPALAAELTSLHRQVLHAIDRSLLSTHYLPRLAQHVAFGSRFITSVDDMRHQGLSQVSRGSDRWTHPEQVTFALGNSSIGKRTALMERPDLALTMAVTPAALARVLDIWPTPYPDRWRGGMPPFPLGPGTLQSVVNLLGGDRSPGGMATAIDGLRLLRDHPRTAPAFWTHALEAWEPNRAMLDALEALAAEGGGPAADAVLQQIADAEVAHWQVPAEVAARARIRLQMRRAPGEEMTTP